VEKVSRQLLRAIRGRRSQVGFARKLGYSANPVTDWENGRSFPTALEMLRAANVAQLNVGNAFARFSPTVPLVATRNGFELAAWMTAILGATSISELARRMGCSRSSLSRWASGKAQPRVPDFLRFIDCATGRVSDWVAALVPIEQVPELLVRHRATEAAKRIALDYPWTEALLRIFELEGAPSLQTPSVLARALGVDEVTVVAAIEALLQAQLIALHGKGYRVLGPLTVDTSGGRAALHEIKAHWSRAAATRALAPHVDDVFGYNVISVSRTDLQRIAELLKHTYREIRAIVASSEPPERAALVNLQLVNWELPEP
jgi:transcriptional regulator with XRE-family HTH domain